MEFDTTRKVLIAIGNVVVTRGADVLHCDYAEVYRETQDVKAKGNIHFERDGQLWEGEELSYNFQTRQGDFGAFEAFTPPFYVRAQESKRVSESETYLEDVELTTCEGPNPDFAIQASSARITEGEVLRAKNVVFFFGPVPFFWLPYLRKDLDSTNIDVVPGYSSEMGAFLLTAYNYRINPYLKGATHLDYRTKRGVGVGQDFLWEDPAGTYEGQLLTYYANDQEPFEDEEEEAERGDLIDKDRYRIRLTDRHNVNERAYTLTELNYLSDPDILEDFFEDEFRHGVQPENRMSLTHRADKYTANLLLNMRLNDFYENVNRLPEASVDMQRQRVAESPFYYDGQHNAVYLERVFPDGSGSEDYDAARMDTENTFYYPTRHFGFLNLIPRAGYRGTFYSKTKEDTFSTDTTISITTNDVGDLVATTNVADVVTTEDQDAELRNILELGAETSFKAFKILHEEPLWGDFTGLRHVVEPFADYTYVPEPNVTPDQLYQFDSIDTLDKRNDIEFGLRNKLQTKRRDKRPHDLVDFVVSSTYLLDPEDDQYEFGSVNFDSEFRLVDWMTWDLDGAVDPEEGTLTEFNTQLAFIARDDSRLALEYRFRDESRDQLATELTLFPNARWSFGTYLRYNFDESRMEEQEYMIQKVNDCIGLGIGYRRLDDGDEPENRVFGQIWLTAFPRSGVNLGR